jgi:hypothetical protein
VSDRVGPHPGRVLGALAVEAHLRAFSAVVLDGPVPAADVAVATGTALRVATRALASLAAAGLVVEQPDGRWRADSDVLRDAARAASRLRPAIDPEDLGAGREEAGVLRAFLVDGRLTTVPVQRTKRLVVLDFLAQRFEPGRAYRESAVNDELGRFHQDHATLRRLLVDEGFLERRAGQYWRSGGTFEV